MKLILFDIDGTLVETGFDDACFIDAFKKTFGIEISDSNWNNFENATDSGITADILTGFFGKKPEEYDIKAIKKEYVRNLRKSVRLNPDQIYEVPGSKKIIKELGNKNGCIPGIATGCWKESALIKLKTAGLAFRGIELSHSGEYSSKTDIIKNIIMKIKKKHNITCFEKIIYIGDRVYDFNIAVKLDLEFIGIDSRNDGILKKSGAVVFNNFNNNKLIEYLS